MTTPAANVMAPLEPADVPTVTGTSEALFGLDASAANAARAAVSGARHGPARSPLASTKLPTAGSDEDEVVPTRAIAREELARPATQDAHVVVGDDAIGDDATLAVMPGENEASSQRFGALAQAAAQDPKFPPPGMFPSPAGPAHPVAAPQSASQAPQGPQGPQSWREPPPASWSPSGPVSAPMHAAHPHQPSSNPHVPATHPHVQGGYPMSAMGGLPAHNAGPMSGSMAAPMSYPGQYMNGPAAPPDLAADEAAQRKKQLLLVGIVGAVCLAIFITGVVLYVTTKF